jgi:hypothetical protein
MIGKFLARIFIFFVAYMLLCAVIHFVSYFSLSKKIFLNIPAFRIIQKNLYYGDFLEVWQNKSDCVTFDKKLIYVPKIGTCNHENAEFNIDLKFTKNGRFMPRINEENNKAILVIGDSHAMGWGVRDDETFSYVLQNLSKRPVYNLAVSSYGTAREVVRLNNSSVLNKADLIIIQYHENDLKENLQFSSLEKDSYKDIFSHMISSDVPVNILDTKNISIKKNPIFTMKKILREYKSSLRLVFTDLTGLFIKKGKEVNFKPHYKSLIKNVQNIEGFNNKKIIIFYSSSSKLKFYNFPKGYDEKNPNVYFHDIFDTNLPAKTKLEKKDFFYLDKHPNKNGHKKIGENLYRLINNIDN